jgi:hypothetical protein
MDLVIHRLKWWACQEVRGHHSPKGVQDPGVGGVVPSSQKVGSL